MRCAIAAACFVVLAALPPSGVASPAGVRVSPVSLTVAPTQATTTVRIENGRAAPASFQIDVYAWSQNDGVDVLTRTRDIAAAPSIFELPPGGSRLIRVALGPSARRSENETSYRLIFKELPTGDRQAGHTRVLLELSLPLFAPPPDAAPNFSARREGRTIVLANSGRAHVRLLGVDGNATANDAQTLPRYLLAGSTLRLPETANTDTLRVRFLLPGASAPAEKVLALAPDPVPAADR